MQVHPITADTKTKCPRNGEVREHTCAAELGQLRVSLLLGLVEAGTGVSIADSGKCTRSPRRGQDTIICGDIPSVNNFISANENYNLLLHLRCPKSEAFHDQV